MNSVEKKICDALGISRAEFEERRAQRVSMNSGGTFDFDAFNGKPDLRSLGERSADEREQTLPQLNRVLADLVRAQRLLSQSTNEMTRDSDTVLARALQSAVEKLQAIISDVGGGTETMARTPLLNVGRSHFGGRGR